MKKSLFILFAALVVVGSTSCAKGYGCQYNNVEIEQPSEPTPSKTKFL